MDIDDFDKQINKLMILGRRLKKNTLTGNGLKKERPFISKE